MGKNRGKGEKVQRIKDKVQTRAGSNTVQSTMYNVQWDTRKEKTENVQQKTKKVVQCTKYKVQRDTREGKKDKG